MGLRAYLSLIGLGTLLSWFAWAVVLVMMNPDESGWFGFVMFYVSFGIAIAGTLTLILSIIRIYVMRRNVVEREVRVSFRHAIMFACIVIASLALTASGHFSSWYMIGFLFVSVAIEYLFLQAHRGKG
jgi:hypothetical protein